MGKPHIPGLQVPLSGAGGTLRLRAQALQSQVKPRNLSPEAGTPECPKGLYQLGTRDPTQDRRVSTLTPKNAKSKPRSRARGRHRFSLSFCPTKALRRAAAGDLHSGA